MTKSFRLNLHLNANIFTLVLVSFTTYQVEVLASTDPSDRFEVSQSIDIPTLEKEGVLLDGHLDEPVWQQAALIDDFHQINPNEYQQPTQYTVVRLFITDEHLYVGAVLHDTHPDLIVAKQLNQRGRMSNDDQFWILLDTFNDQRNGYYLQANANSIGGDALVENNSNMIWDWDGIWEVKSQRGDFGWSLEMKIPFKTLSYDADNPVWGFNMGRAISRLNEEIQWSSKGRQDFSEAPAYAGQLNGMDIPPAGLSLDVVPSVALAEGDLNQGVNTLEPALDVFYRPNATNTLALTLNTDFSATEVDDRQVNLTRFSLFFPEKRDFFLQDAGIFEFGGLSGNGNPFFSRSIGIGENGVPLSLQAGVKWTGRQGRYSYGVLGIQQDDPVTGLNSELGIARLSANVLNESQFGAIMTYGDPNSDQRASTAGLDFRYRNSQLAGSSNTMSLNTFVQQTKQANSSGDDMAYGFDWRFPNDRHTARFRATEIQNNFAPALGFVNRTHIRDYLSYYRFQVRPSHEKIRAVKYWLWLEMVTDLDNQLESRSFFTFVGINGVRDDWATLQFRNAREVLSESFEISPGIIIPEGGYGWQELSFFYGTDAGRKWSIEGNLRSGGFYGGDKKSMKVTTRWKPSSHFNVALNYQMNSIKLPQGDFITRLASINNNIAINAEWSIITNLQYDNVSDTLGINSRLRWVPKVGQEFFLVYNHNADVDDDHSLINRQHSTTLKASYTYRF